MEGFAAAAYRSSPRASTTPVLTGGQPAWSSICWMSLRELPSEPYIRIAVSHLSLSAESWRFADRARPLSVESIWIWCRLRWLWYRRRGEYERPGTSDAIHQRLVGGPSSPYGCPGSRRAAIRWLRLLAGHRCRRADSAGINRVNHKLAGGYPIGTDDQAARFPARQRRRTRVRLGCVEGR